MKDERIQTTHNRIAAITSKLWYWLIVIAIFYRVLILKQHLPEIWDIVAIYLIVTSVGFFAKAGKGLFAHFPKWAFLSLGIAIAIVLLAFVFFKGQIHSVADAGRFLIASLLGMGPAFGIVYFLNRRWKRKEGIEEEKDENPNAGAPPSK